MHNSHGENPGLTSPGVRQKAQDVAIPQITRVRDLKWGDCTKIGSDFVIISGRNLGDSTGKGVVIGLPDVHYHPTVRNWSNEQIRVWMKSPGLNRGKSYPIAIETSGHSRVLSNTNVLVQICPN